MKSSILMLLAVAALLLGACANSVSGPNLSTIQFKPDGAGAIQFKTNDSAMDGGWVYPYSAGAQTPMTIVTATVNKVSGYVWGGSGIVFCYTDMGNFYRLLVDADGYYTVTCKSGGTYLSSPLIDWTPSTYLVPGFNVVNTVEVRYTGSSNFDIYFNGNHETSFSNSSILPNGQPGYYVYVDSSYENFPNTPLDQRFSMSSPVVDPPALVMNGPKGPAGFIRDPSPAYCRHK